MSIMNINDCIGNRIKELRKERNFTAEQLAWTAGLSKNCISCAENGTKNIKMVSLNALCNAMDITLAEFFSSFDEKFL